MPVRPKIALFVVMIATLAAVSPSVRAQQVEVVFERVSVNQGDEGFFRIFINSETHLSGAVVPLLLSSVDIIVDSVSFRYSVAQEFVLSSRFNNNNRREFITMLPPLGGSLPTVPPPGGELCRVHFKVDPFFQGGAIPIDSFINTIFVGDYRIDQQLEISDQFGTRILPDFHPGEIYVTEMVEADTTSDGEETPGDVLPSSFTLRQNYPNPFNPSTRITFSLPYSSDISLAVYDGVGREVEVLAAGGYSPGTHSVDWDATNYTSGIYFYRLVTPDGTLSRKMVVIK